MEYYKEIDTIKKYLKESTEVKEKKVEKSQAQTAWNISIVYLNY